MPKMNYSKTFVIYISEHSFFLIYFITGKTKTFKKILYYKKCIKKHILPEIETFHQATLKVQIEV